MSFFANTRKPTGLGGRIMLTMMNIGHAALARWGLQFLELSADADVLDCGCGGANIGVLLKKCPQGKVYGLDVSPLSVKKAQRRNRKSVAAGRCAIRQGSAAQIELCAETLDAVTAFETVYFWPELAQCFREVYRVLKPDGTFLICNECSADTAAGEKWARIIDGMTIYPDAYLKAALRQAGFRHIRIRKSPKGWRCVTGQKQAESGLQP